MKDDKEFTIINKENSIRKSNELSTAKLFHGLTLNQMQLFAYAIYVTQKNSETTFRKVDFEKKFEIEKYQTKQAKQDSRQLMSLAIELQVDDTDSFMFRSVFNGIDYKKGKFTFEWSSYIKPHILELKNKFIETDLSITMNFKSSFSWSLYDALKASYGKYYLELSKNDLMELFNVERVKSYRDNTGLFKKNVLDVAIDEINKYTEYNVSYSEIKRGRSIIAFKILFNKGQTVKGATDKQIEYLKTLVEITKEQVIFEILNIESREQRNLAKDVVKTILTYSEKIDDALTAETADTMIKEVNEKISFIKSIMEKEIKNQDENIHDPYKDLEIPIYDF